MIMKRLIWVVVAFIFVVLIRIPSLLYRTRQGGELVIISIDTKAPTSAPTRPILQYSNKSCPKNFLEEILFVNSATEPMRRINYNKNCDWMFKTKAMMDYLNDGKPKVTTLNNIKRRNIFLAGLESTGHHYWQVYLSNEYRPNCMVSDVAKDTRLMDSQWIPVSEYNAMVARLTRAYKNSPDMSTPRFINLMNKTLCRHGESTGGMHSYPNGGGQFKKIKRPTLIDLARAATNAGSDFKAILLVRNISHVVVSGLQKGYTKTLEEQIEMNYSNLVALYLQASVLSKGSILGCFDYDNPKESSEKVLRRAGFNVIPELGGFKPKQYDSLPELPEKLLRIDKMIRDKFC